MPSPAQLTSRRSCRMFRLINAAELGLTMLTALLPGACGEARMTMNGRMKGDLSGAFKLEGPIQIQMQLQGPTVKYDGVYVSDKLLDRVEVGKTRPDWLIAVLGEPTGKAPLDDGSEIWKWSYRPLEQEASVFSVFGGGSQNEPKLQPSTAFVRLNGRVVVEKWRD